MLTRGVPAIWSNNQEQLRAYVSTLKTVSEMVPIDSIWNTQWKNIEFVLDYTPLRGVDRNIAFNYQSTGSWYEIHFTASSFQVLKLKNGATVWAENLSYQLINGKTYRIAIKFDRGLIQIFVDDAVIYDHLDTTFTDQDYGKVALKVGTGLVYPTEVIFDNVAVYDLDQTENTSQTPLFKQSDPEWADDEYDSASNWSENTKIKHWGCALTSAAMVLQSHGINTLPNSQWLTPGALNAWLIEQPDGYWGNGLLNWMAITRISHLMSATLGTPSLEYQRLNSRNWLTDSITSIQSGAPVILEVPGHFLVADAVNPNHTDLLIKDPAYAYTNFSQHQKEVKSIRLLKPSHTDLSYIAMAVDKDVSLQVITPDEETIDVTDTQYLQIPSGEESNFSWATPELKILELPKPQTGEYQFLLSQTEPSQENIEIFAYNQAGEVQDLSLSTYVSQQPTAYILDYATGYASVARSACTP